MSPPDCREMVLVGEEGADCIDLLQDHNQRELEFDDDNSL